MKMNPTALEAAQLIDRLERLTRSGVAVDGLNPAQWEALRYLARANRFSRTPAALSDYLASTRGTVSQTLIALEHKGFVSRTQSARDKRSIDLELTSEGDAALKRDPLLDLAHDLSVAAGSDLASIVDTLRAALRLAVARNGGKPFGACHTCRHFKRNVAAGARAPHMCNLLNEALTDGDSRAICVEQELAEG